MEIPQLLIWSAINFALFAGGMVLLLRRPMQAFFAKRAALLQDEVAQAQRAEQAANDRLVAIQGRLDQMETEMAELRRRLRAEGEQERLTMVRRAQSAAEKTHRETERMIAQELERGQHELRKTAVDMAILMAERILREQISPEDQRRLALNFVEKLSSLH